MHLPAIYFRNVVLAGSLFSIVLSPYAQDKRADWNVQVLDQILASVPAGEKLARVGDMEILVSNLRAWRNELAGQPAPGLAFDGNAPIWTGGDLYYTFDPSVSAAHQKAFLDGAKECHRCRRANHHRDGYGCCGEHFSFFRRCRGHRDQQRERRHFQRVARGAFRRQRHDDQQSVLRDVRSRWRWRK